MRGLPLSCGMHASLHGAPCMVSMRDTKRDMLQVSPPHVHARKVCHASCMHPCSYSPLLCPPLAVRTRAATSHKMPPRRDVRSMVSMLGAHTRPQEQWKALETLTELSCR